MKVELVGGPFDGMVKVIHEGNGLRLPQHNGSYKVRTGLLGQVLQTGMPRLATWCPDDEEGELA